MTLYFFTPVLFLNIYVFAQECEKQFPENPKRKEESIFQQIAREKRIARKTNWNQAGFDTIKKQPPEVLRRINFNEKINIINSLSIEELGHLTSSQRKALLKPTWRLHPFHSISEEKQKFLLPDLTPRQMRSLSDFTMRRTRVNLYRSLNDEERARLSAEQVEALLDQSFFNSIATSKGNEDTPNWMIDMDDRGRGSR